MSTKFLRISASQIKTFRLCRRKWWFQKVRKLKGPNRNPGSLIFGKVLHGVCERWLGADDQGRDPSTGDPVDLTPPGWLDTEEGSLDPNDGAWILHLVSKGYLARVPGRKVEQEFWEVLDAETPILINGFMDLTYPDTVVDHKTSGSSRYLLTDKPDTDRYLGDDVQMLIYAKITGATELVHNQFLKHPDGQGNPDVRQVRVKVDPDDVQGAWVDVRSTSHAMKDLQGSEDPPEVELGSHCNAYGGCPYLSICQGKETPKKFQKRMLRMISDREKIQPTKEDEVSFAEKMAAMRAAAEKKAPSINPLHRSWTQRISTPSRRPSRL